MEKQTLSNEGLACIFNDVCQWNVLASACLALQMALHLEVPHAMPPSSRSICTLQHMQAHEGTHTLPGSSDVLPCPPGALPHHLWLSVSSGGRSRSKRNWHARRRRRQLNMKSHPAIGSVAATPLSVYSLTQCKSRTN